jgi:hypothetical protein
MTLDIGCGERKIEPDAIFPALDVRCRPRARKPA